MQFTLALPAQTIFGWGRVAELPALARRFGARVALAAGRRGTPEITEALTTAGLAVIPLPPQIREPEPDDVDAAAAVARDAGAELVIAVGGGSVLDLGKAVAALAAQPPYPVREYLEDVGVGRTLARDPLPFLAVPTTAGTGTEATKNAVISSQREGFKKSLRDPRMLAEVALIDPALTITVPPHLTAWTGLDAVTQCLEAYTSCRATPVTDALALQGLRAATALPVAVADGAHREAREAMALAAYLSGICLANAGLGAAHGLAAALGSLVPVHHGLACALALPHVMAANLAAVPERYAAVAAALGGDPTPDGALDAVRVLLRRLDLPRAVDVFGALLDEAYLPEIARRSHGNSLRGNPRPLDDADLVAILRAMRES
jgi:alcohol dehydrogenase class IV